MNALANLTAAFDDIRAAVFLGVERIRQLSHELAAARAEVADANDIEQIATELHATADQLRRALAAVDATHPPIDPEGA